MDADMSESCEMDNLVVAYFGQDCDIFDPEMKFDNLLNEYLETSPSFNLRILLANIDEFQRQSEGVRIFSERYQHDFWPERWEMTTEEWITRVKERVVEYLHSKGVSSELSHF